MRKFGSFMYATCLVLLITIVVVIRPLSNLDEIWNFNIARCIANGLVPYRDISMVSTPLMGFLMAIPLKLFGQELFYTRIFAIVLALLIFVQIFKIFKNIDIKIEVVHLVTIGITALMFNYIRADYNLLALLIVLTIELLEIKMLKVEKWDKYIVHLIVGVLAGLVICTKQSIGLIICIVVILAPIIYIHSKKEAKKRILSCIVRLFGIAIPVGAFAIYLHLNGSWNDFINYGVWGIKTFSNSISYESFFTKSNIVYKILIVLIPAVIVMSALANIVLRFKKRDENELYALVLYAAGMFSIVFPIADNAHFAIAVIPGIILTVFGIKALMDQNNFISKLNYKYILEFVNVCSVLIILCATLGIEYVYNEELGLISEHDYQNHYRYIDIPEGISNSINTIKEFSETNSNKIYILDASAAVYMIPADRYNKDYDMLVIGNIGADGEESIINRIKSEDALYLILRDEQALNWQNPNKIRAYVKENMDYIGTKDCFDVYQNKAENDENTNAEENKTE